MTVNIDFSTLELMDALDLAVLIEVEAWERYTNFVRQLGRGRPGDAGDIFNTMAINEEKHGHQLSERRQELFGNTPLRVNADDIFDVEAPDAGAPRRNMSPLKAFQVALSSEEKAFWFYDEALKHVTDPAIRELFTELRDEEIEHVDMVKQAIAALPPGSDIDQEDEDD
jgi:rubrerythrin